MYLIALLLAIKKNVFQKQYCLFYPLLITLCYNTAVLAQKQNNIWHFGNGACVDFNGSIPVSLPNSGMYSIEGCASISDPRTGNLLFYSNGLTVWNKNNVSMPNGSDLLGAPSTSATQGVLIVPYPKNTSKYFVFTVDETNNSSLNGFRYSIVDMKLDNGKGDIIADQKNILIQNNTTERLCVAKKADGNGYWVIIHERNNSIFKVYDVSRDGLNPTPVISNVGDVHSTMMMLNGDKTMGCMKVNQANSKIAVAIYADNKIQVFDFDNCSGIISNPTSITCIDNPYGISFSPDDSRLYYTLYNNSSLLGQVYQLDMLAPDIRTTTTLVGISSSINAFNMGDMQIGPDNKIYIAINSESWLSAIENPNQLGVACIFTDKAIPLIRWSLSPSPGLFGLPQRILLDSLSFIDEAILATNTCVDANTNFTISGNPSFNQIYWDFGDVLSNSNTDSLLQTSHNYSTAGTYTVKAILYNDCSLDTLVTSIQINACTDSSTDCQIIFPDAFTPNNDQLNDLFAPLYTCSLASYQLTIFNRWGQTIFYSSNPNNAWNGKINNVDAAADHYAYLLQYNFQNQSPKISNGTFLLVR